MVSHAREGLCSVAFLRTHCHAIHQVPHNCNVVQRAGIHVFNLALTATSNEPSNDRSIHLHCTFERKLCYYRIQLVVGRNWISRAEMQREMVGGRVGFLV